jgi:hypothetical protein
MVEDCIAMGEPFFMEGPVGVGKSQVVAQVCKKLKIELIDLRMSQMSPEDIKGFPWPDAAKGVMRYLPMSQLPPMKAKTRGLVFLDELNSAALAIQAPSYQLILDRCIGEYILPAGWTVGGAGNKLSDRAIVNRMSSALNNRFVHMDYETSVEDVVTHGRTVGFHDHNIAFLRWKPDLLHSFDPTLNPKAFPTPRSWFKVDKIMKQNLPAAREFNLIVGTVGHGAAVVHREFMKMRLTLPTVADIQAHPDKTVLPRSAGELFAITTAIATGIKPETYPNFLRYMRRAEKEWQIIFNKDATKVCPELLWVPEFKQWSIENSEVML